MQNNAKVVTIGHASGNDWLRSSHGPHYDCFVLGKVRCSEFS